MTGSSWLHVGDENFGALLHLHGECGIPDVAAGEAEMEPAAGLIVDFFRDGGGKADDVVVEGLFQFLLAFDEPFQVGETLVRAGFDFLKVSLGDDALGDERFGSKKFDLQPNLELVFVGPNAPHFGARIACNHTLIKRKKGERCKSVVEALKCENVET